MLLSRMGREEPPGQKDRGTFRELAGHLDAFLGQLKRNRLVSLSGWRSRFQILTLQPRSVIYVF